jgi:hypothetical protein
VGRTREERTAVVAWGKLGKSGEENCGGRTDEVFRRFIGTFGSFVAFRCSMI